jgi:hypothetical protein
MCFGNAGLIVVVHLLRRKFFPEKSHHTQRQSIFEFAHRDTVHFLIRERSQTSIQPPVIKKHSKNKNNSVFWHELIWN